VNKLIRLTIVLLLATAARANALDRLCDPSFENCRTPLLDLIRAETVQIDVAWWFMEDSRYSTEIIKRWQAGVPVRVIIDPRATATYPLNGPILDAVRTAGIPMRKKTTGGILHWKTMVFRGQNTVEFSGANFSADAFVYVDPYKNYVDEAIYFTDDPVIVNSFQRKYDDLWVDTINYSNYANITTPLARSYPLYTISPDMNFPPGQDYANRAVKLYDAETQKIDVIMYRITDRRHSDAMLRAQARGIPVRLYTDQDKEYRNVARLWHSWNVDRMWLAGIPIKVPNHMGINHEKAVILYSQSKTIFGSSNWTSASANSQQEHNYFTTKTALVTWFINQFERKWNNTNLIGAIESKNFVPLPPDKPVYQSVANGATGVPTTGQGLVWYGGPWAHIYDIYFGTDPAAMTLFAGAQPLGPSLTTTQMQSFALPTLQPATTYYWKIVSKTAALLAKEGPIWSFTTAGAAPPPPAGVTTVVLWTSSVAAGSLVGNWTRIADTTAAGQTALQNTDKGAAKIAPALVSPANYFETTFSASAGVAYHLWVRMRAQNNSSSNDSVHVQFSDSLDAPNGSAAMRFGTTSSAEVILQAGPSGAPDHGWGWGDNGWGVPGAHVYFAADGTHTLRVQQREDGAIIDQIVLSPDTYLTSPPGGRVDDATILQPTNGSAPPPPPPPPPSGSTLGPGDVLLHPADATTIVGEWARQADTTAATSASLLNPDHGAAKIAAASASPANYFEMTFDAPAGTAYRLWMRGKATNNSFSNDSVFIQFGDSVDANGTPAFGIPTTNSTGYNLEDCNGCGLSGWGWQDNAWGIGVQPPLIYFATGGTHTIRIQVREDGLALDQILLSPQKFLNASPGALKNDTTILQ